MVVILYVVDDSPKVGSLEHFIAMQWNFSTNPKIFYHNDGYFLARFNNIDDKNEVLYSGPHTMNNRLIIIKTWEGDFNFNNEVLKTISIWVKLPTYP